MEDIKKYLDEFIAAPSSFNSWLSLGTALDNVSQVNVFQKSFMEAFTARSFINKFLSPDILTHGNAMIKKGEFWAVIFDGKLNYFQDCDGIFYVAFLIQHADDEIHTTRLFNERKPSGAIKYDDVTQLGEQKELLKIRYSLDPSEAVYDKSSITDMRRAVEMLTESIEDNKLNDPEKAIEQEEERNRILKLISSTTGKDGKSRTFVNTPDRIRRTVYNAIDRELDKFKIHLPELWEHLKNDKRLRTGTFCRYISTANINWGINF
jgi:hypothetical protein